MSKLGGGIESLREKIATEVYKLYNNSIPFNITRKEYREECLSIADYILTLVKKDQKYYRREEV
jgi:hypothetical protein